MQHARTHARTRLHLLPLPRPTAPASPPHPEAAPPPSTAAPAGAGAGAARGEAGWGGGGAPAAAPASGALTMATAAPPPPPQLSWPCLVVSWIWRVSHRVGPTKNNSPLCMYVYIHISIHRRGRPPAFASVPCSTAPRSQKMALSVRRQRSSPPCFPPHHPWRRRTHGGHKRIPRPPASMHDAVEVPDIAYANWGSEQRRVRIDRFPPSTSGRVDRSIALGLRSRRRSSLSSCCSVRLPGSRAQQAGERGRCTRSKASSSSMMLGAGIW